MSGSRSPRFASWMQQQGAQHAQQPVLFRQRLSGAFSTHSAPMTIMLIDAMFVTRSHVPSSSHDPKPMSARARARRRAPSGVKRHSSREGDGVEVDDGLCSLSRVSLGLERAGGGGEC